MKETLSALIDGELDAAEAISLLDKVKTGETELASAWSDWHVIGDAMRRKPLLLVDVGAGVRAALKAEDMAPPAPAVRPAAGRFRLVAAGTLVAAVTAAAVVGWTQLDKPDSRPAAMTAMSSSASGGWQGGFSVAMPEPLTPNPYVLAHQELALETSTRHVALEVEIRP